MDPHHDIHVASWALKAPMMGSGLSTMWQLTDCSSKLLLLHNLLGQYIFDPSISWPLGCRHQLRDDLAFVIFDQHATWWFICGDSHHRGLHFRLQVIPTIVSIVIFPWDPHWKGGTSHALPCVAWVLWQVFISDLSMTPGTFREQTCYTEAWIFLLQTKKKRPQIFEKRVI